MEMPLSQSPASHTRKGIHPAVFIVAVVLALMIGSAATCFVLYPSVKKPAQNVSSSVVTSETDNKVAADSQGLAKTDLISRKVYQSEKWKFSVSYPATWTQDKAFAVDQVAFAVPIAETKNNTEDVEIAIETESTNLNTLQEWIDSQKWPGGTSQFVYKSSPSKKLSYAEDVVTGTVYTLNNGRIFAIENGVSMERRVVDQKIIIDILEHIDFTNQNAAKNVGSHSFLKRGDLEVSFDVPQGWNMESSDNSEFISLFPPERPTRSQENEYVGDIIIQLRENPKNLDVRSFFKQPSEEAYADLAEAGEETTVGGTHVWLVKDIPGMVTSTVAVMTYPGALVTVNDVQDIHQDDGVFTNILSSFQFVADQETFSDTKLGTDGFKAAVPSGWSIVSHSATYVSFRLSSSASAASTVEVRVEPDKTPLVNKAGATKTQIAGADAFATEFPADSNLAVQYRFADEKAPGWKIDATYRDLRSNEIQKELQAKVTELLAGFSNPS